VSLGDVTFAALRRAVSQAVVAFWVTLGFFVVLSIVLSIAANSIANGGFEGFLASVLALAAGLVAGGYGAYKRAIGRGLHGAVDEARIGARLVDTLINRIGKVTGKLSLPDANAKLDAAARQGDPEVRGWFARIITHIALRIVKSLLMRKFSEQAAKIGAVDIPALEEGLGARIDMELLARVETMLAGATAIAFAIAAAGLLPAILFRYGG
jgi:hypothetical protein